MSEDDFWIQMHAKGWVYASYLGQEHPISDLPENVTGLKDDPYRSLAAAVRNAGGYDKNQAPFSEFKWADFMRTRITSSELEKDFDAATKLGVQLAGTVDAKDLPGYHPASQEL